MNRKHNSLYSVFMAGLAAACLLLGVAACATAPASSSTPATQAKAPADSPAAPAAGIGKASGMPLPGSADKLVPAGSGCNLAILDWAGFEGAASYSFDDGQPSQIAHWPELKATGVPMTFYLMPASNWPSGYDATWKDALASGSELGNHTNTHKRLNEYADDAALAADVAKCAAYIRTKLGQTVPCSFAYPFGETGWVDVLGDDFLLARSVYSGSISPLDDTDPLQLPIFPVTSNHTQQDFIDALDQNADDKTWVIFMYHSVLPGDNWFAGVSIDSIVGSLEHAKAGGRLWLDTVQNVGTYWLAQKLLAETTATGTDTAKTWKWTLPKNYPAGKYLRVKVDSGVLSQAGQDLTWNPHGFYEVALDAGQLDWRQ